MLTAQTTLIRLLKRFVSMLAFLQRREQKVSVQVCLSLYILWEVKCQVYSFWPHFKTPPTTFFYSNCRSWGISFFAEQNEQLLLSAQLQGFKVFFKTNTQRTTPNKTNSQRTAQITYLRRLEHFVRLFGKNWDIPRTYAHTCTTMRCKAFCWFGSGSLSNKSEGGQVSAHSTRVTVTLLSPIRAVTVTRLLAAVLWNRRR